jgi:hypothetical protein
MHRILKCNWNKPKRKKPTKETKNNALGKKSVGGHSSKLMQHRLVASDLGAVRTVRYSLGGSTPLLNKKCM